MVNSNRTYNVTIKEEFFPNDIKIDVYTRTWEPQEASPIAHVVFVHGQAEHVTRYDHVFTEFAKVGIKVHGFDQVGCGRTGEKAKDLGGALGLGRVLLDTNDAIDRIYDPDIPLFLYGHSFGGASVLNYLALGERRDLLHGAISTSPCIKVSRQSAPFYPVKALLNQLAPIFPHQKVPVKLDNNLISRDKEVVKRYTNDPLIFSRCSMIQARDVLFEGENLFKRYKHIRVPRLYVIHGTGDGITDHKATASIVEKLKAQGHIPKIDLKLFEGGYHELHNDTIKEEVIACNVNWLLQQL